MIVFDAAYDAANYILLMILVVNVLLLLLLMLIMLIMMIMIMIIMLVLHNQNQFFFIIFIYFNYFHISYFFLFVVCRMVICCRIDISLMWCHFRIYHRYSIIYLQILNAAFSVAAIIYLFFINIT